MPNFSENQAKHHDSEAAEMNNVTDDVTEFANTTPTYQNVSELYGNSTSLGLDAEESSSVVLEIPRVIFYTLVMVITCGGNILVIVVIKRTPSLQTITNKFVLWLAAADLLAGSSVFLRFVQIYYPAAVNNYTVCQIRYFTVSFPGLWGSFILIGIAVERYIGVFKSLHYHRYITERRVDIALSMTGLICALVSTGPPLGLNVWHPDVDCDAYTLFDRTFWMVCNVTYLATVTSDIYVYGLIISEIRKFKRAMESLSALEKAARQQQFTDDTRAIKTFFLVISIYACSWGPMLVTGTLYNSNIEYYHYNKMYQTWWTFCTLLVLMNSSCNCFIYALRFNQFRKPMLNVLCCKWLGNASMPRRICCRDASVAPSRDEGSLPQNTVDVSVNA